MFDDAEVFGAKAAFVWGIVLETAHNTAFLHFLMTRRLLKNLSFVTDVKFSMKLCQNVANLLPLPASARFHTKN